MGLGVTLLILSLLLPSLLRRQQPLSPADYDRLEELDNKVVDIHLEMEAFLREIIARKLKIQY